MTLDELRNLDFKDIASMPLPVKIAGIGIICVLILAAGYWFIISDELAERDAAQRQELALRQKYKEKKLLALNLPVYRKQMVEIRQTFGSLLRQLPNTTEVPDLLVDITQAGLGRGLEFSLFRPQPERPRDFYAELPIHLAVTGTYHQLAEFISDVAALPRIVTFGNITITRGKGKKKGDELSMVAVARTYRYLEPGEIKAKSPHPRRGRRR